MGTGSPKHENAQVSTWKLVVLGCGVSFLATFVISAIGGIITTLFTFRPETVNAAIPVIGYVSAGIGGVWAGRKTGEKGGRNGFAVGLAYLFTVLLISAAFVREPMSTVSIAVRGISTVIVSTLGGIIGVNL